MNVPKWCERGVVEFTLTLWSVLLVLCPPYVILSPFHTNLSLFMLSYLVVQNNYWNVLVCLFWYFLNISYRASRVKIDAMQSASILLDSFLSNFSLAIFQMGLKGDIRTKGRDLLFHCSGLDSICSLCITYKKSYWSSHLRMVPQGSSRGIIVLWLCLLSLPLNANVALRIFHTGGGEMGAPPKRREAPSHDRLYFVQFAYFIQIPSLMLI